jgi:hypothetical protein
MRGSESAARGVTRKNPVGNMKSSLDIIVPVAGILGVVVFFTAASELVKANGALKQVAGIRAEVVRYEDVTPFSTQKPSRFGLKYPVVRYLRDGKPRDEGIYFARVSPGHFQIGEEVAIGKVEGQMVILDRWYIWQEHLVYIVGSLAAVIGTFYYYWRWRPARADALGGKSGRPPLSKPKETDRVPVTRDWMGNPKDTSRK